MNSWWKWTKRFELTELEPLKLVFGAMEYCLYKYDIQPTFVFRREYTFEIRYQLGYRQKMKFLPSIFELLKSRVDISLNIRRYNQNL